MAGRCGCAGTCGCLLQAGAGITVTGAGTSINPWVVSLNPATLCPQVMDCVGAGAGDGLTYDPVTHTLTVRYSGDLGNTTGPGSDGGIFTPPAGTPGSMAILAIDTNEILHTGDGAQASPLSHRLTGNRYGNWTLIDGNVYTGSKTGAGRGYISYGQVTAGYWVGYSLLPSALAADGALLSVLSSDAAAANNEVAWSFAFDKTGHITTIQPGTAPTAARYRPIPWATQHIEGSFNLGQPGTTTVTFVAGRFTDTPVLHIQIYSSAWWGGILARSNVSCQVSTRHYDNVMGSGPVPGALQAVQMYASTAVGFAAPAPAPPLRRLRVDDDIVFDPYTVTCHTAGCENNGIPLDVLVALPVTPTSVVCGGCSLPITDVVAYQGGV